MVTEVHSITQYLVGMDEDQVGASAVKQISRLSRAMKCIQVSQGKDVNDFYKILGQEVFLQWLNDILLGCIGIKQG